MAPSVPEALKKKRVAHQAALAKRALAQQNAKKANVIKRRAIIKVKYHKILSEMDLHMILESCRLRKGIRKPRTSFDHPYQTSQG